MKKLGAIVLFAFTAPWSFTVGWGWVLLLWACCFAEKLRWEPTGVLTAQWAPWVLPHWRYSTTIGRGIIYQPKHRADAGDKPTHIQRHEHVHIRQVEDLMILGFVLGAVVFYASGDPWLGLVLWWSSGMWQLPNFLAAVLRGGNIYRDSEHERSAYAQCDLDIHGKAWLDQRQTAL